MRSFTTEIPHVILVSFSNGNSHPGQQVHRNQVWDPQGCWWDWLTVGMKMKRQGNGELWGSVDTYFSNVLFEIKCRKIPGPEYQTLVSVLGFQHLHQGRVQPVCSLAQAPICSQKLQSVNGDPTKVSRHYIQEHRSKAQLSRRAHINIGCLHLS